MTHHREQHPLQVPVIVEVMDRKEAEALGLVYGMSFQHAVLGLAHEHGHAVVYVARTDPQHPGEEWAETWYHVGSGHKGLYNLRTLLRTTLGMLPRVACAVAHPLRPYVLCLAPTRHDLPKLLAHEDALVRSTTQLQMESAR